MKKIISAFICLALIIGCVPASASYTDEYCIAAYYMTELHRILFSTDSLAAYTEYGTDYPLFPTTPNGDGNFMYYFSPDFKFTFTFYGDPTKTGVERVTISCMPVIFDDYRTGDYYRFIYQMHFMGMTQIFISERQELDPENEQMFNVWSAINNAIDGSRNYRSDPISYLDVATVTTYQDGSMVYVDITFTEPLTVDFLEGRIRAATQK